MHVPHVPNKWTLQAGSLLALLLSSSLPLTLQPYPDTSDTPLAREALGKEGSR